MTLRGLFLALNKNELATLLRARGDPKRREAVAELEEVVARHRQYETDKAWWELKQCLASSAYGGRRQLLARCFGEGRKLHQGTGYVLNLIEPAQLRRVATALEGVTKAKLRQRFFNPRTFAWERETFGTKYKETDFAYAWHWFKGLPAFIRTAADADLRVVFSVDLI